MRRGARRAIVATAMLAVVLGGQLACSSKPSATTVKVKLGDMTGLNGPLTLTATPAHVPEGKVTFVVTNTGTIDHSMIVLQTTTDSSRLPIVAAGDPPKPVTSGANEVEEKGLVGSTGPTALTPGSSRTFTIAHMAAGHYVLLSNIAKQYGMGMRSNFVVTSG